MRLRNSNWLKNVFLPVALCAMEVCWLYPWVLWLDLWAFPEWGQPALNPLSVFGIIILSTFSTRYLLRQKWSMGWVQAVVALEGILVISLVMEGEYMFRLGLLGGYTSFSPKIIATILGAYLWWRGINLGNSRMAFEHVNTSFLIGVIGLLGLLLLSIATQNTRGYVTFQSLAGLYVVVFFMVSLLALSLARLETIREESQKTGIGIGFNRHWLTVLVAVITSIILVTLFAAALLSFDLVRLLATPLSLLADGLFYLFYYILLPISYLVAILIYVFRYLLELFRPRASHEPFTSPDYSDVERLRERAMSSGLAPEVIAVAKWLLLALVASVVVLLFVRAVSRYRRTADEDTIEEIHESLWSWHEALAGLLALLKRLRERLFPRLFGRVPPADVVSQVRPTPPYASLAIREIYQRLLARAKEMGYPRRSEETPYEYLRTLRVAIPESAVDATAITEAYVHARYGLEAPPEAEVSAIRKRWDRILSAMSEKASKQKGKDRES
ncbi:MAG: DUF4129 domain-containing protein [Chloroflexota bacterium]